MTMLTTGRECKHGGKCCFSRCADSGECVGIICPEDKAVCALAACVAKGACSDTVLDEIKSAQAANAATSAVTSSTAPATRPGLVSCHYGFYCVARYGEMELFAGREGAFIGDPYPYRGADPFVLAISLLGPASFRHASPHVTMNAAAKAMLPPTLLVPEIPMLAVDWKDFDVPDVPADWWHELAATLRGIQGSVVIFCQGGHGRTGTATAILASLLGSVPESMCPVEYIRAAYCKEVVETAEQITYIEHVTGRKVTAEPRDTFANDWWTKTLNSPTTPKVTTGGR